MMHAVVYRKFGPPEVLTVEKLETPTPKADEILIRVKAVAVTAADIKARSLNGLDGLFWLPGRLICGFSKPKNPILGSYFSGEVYQVGSEVSNFNIGDRVFGFRMFGANAEFINVKANGVVCMLPDAIGFQAAAVAPFGLLTARTCLKKTNLGSKSRVLVNGASGGVGLATVQLAKSMGAEVTGTCRASKMGLVEKAGADYVIDYQSQSIDCRKVAYDVIVDTSGKLRFSEAVPLLTDEGQLHLIDFRSKDLFNMLRTSFFRGKKVKCHVAEDNLAGFEFVKQFILEEKFHPLIERIYPLEQLSQAHRHFESGNKMGNIVVEIS